LVIMPDDNIFTLCICYRIMALCLCNMFALFEALRKSVLHFDWYRFIYSLLLVHVLNMSADVCVDLYCVEDLFCTFGELCVRTLDV
jgi:hypothetical protein